MNILPSKHFSRSTTYCRVLSFVLMITLLWAHGAHGSQEPLSPLSEGAVLYKNSTTQSLIIAFEKLRSKLTSLVLISREDVAAAHSDYRDIYLQEEKKDPDLAKIFEERYRLACKKIEPIMNKTEFSLKGYEKAKKRLEKIQKEKEELEAVQQQSQEQIHAYLNELAAIYWLEFEQARKTTDLIRKKAEASHQPIKKIVDEEIRILHKGR